VILPVTDQSKNAKTVQPLGGAKPPELHPWTPLGYFCSPESLGLKPPKLKILATSLILFLKI